MPSREQGKQTAQAVGRKVQKIGRLLASRPELRLGAVATVLEVLDVTSVELEQLLEQLRRKERRPKLFLSYTDS